MQHGPTRRQISLGLLGLAASTQLPGCASNRGSAAVTAIDCHAHVFRRDLPMPDRRRAPSGYDATVDDYMRMLDTHAISHGVLIQPSFLGTDNSYLVAALRTHSHRLRGVAVVEPGIGAGELQALAEAGVVGIRLNLIGLPTPDFASSTWAALLRQLRQLHWQVEVHQVAAKLQPVIDPLLAAGLDVVVDHFGRPDDALGVEDPGFRYLLSTGRSRQVWVKLSGAYRNGGHGAGEATALAAVPLLIASHGLDRLVWGSDWPHTLFELTANYTAERQLLAAWLPDPAEQDIVLRRTPQALFRFAV